MKLSSNKSLIVLILIKIVSTLLMLIFPRYLLVLLFPIGFFSPFFTAALAYEETPKFLLVCALLIIAVGIISTILFLVFYFVKSEKKVVTIMTTIFFAIELLSFVLSFILADIMFWKLVGIIYNSVIVNGLRKRCFNMGKDN